MKKYTIIFLLFLLVVYQSKSPAQNLVSNGDFEADFKYWSTAGKVYIADNFAYSGVKSFKVSTTLDEYGYIYQSFATPFTAFEATFWIYPPTQNYHSVFVLRANWTPSNPLEDKNITMVIFTPDTINLRALDKDTTINNILETNYWNKIKVTTDQSGLIKNFSINDQFIGKLTSSAVFPVENILIGDLSTRWNFGTVFYDNVSVVEMNNFHVEFPDYTKSPFDIMVCGSTIPQRTLSFNLSEYQNISLLKLVYGYVNFDKIGGQYPPINPGDVSFSVTMDQKVIDRIAGATNNYRIKREIDLLPYCKNISSVEISFNYESGNNFLEIVRPVLFLVDTTAAQITTDWIKPAEFALHQNYPNPFNSGTEIGYQILAAQHVSLTIYDINGRLVRTLVNEKKNAGTYRVHWNGKDDSGNVAASGVYSYRLQTERFTRAGKATLIK